MRRASLHSSYNPGILFNGGESAPVGRPDFKPGWSCRAVPGRFDSCSLPPKSGHDTESNVALLQQCGLIKAPPSR
jgi:hypothetical protein